MYQQFINQGTPDVPNVLARNIVAGSVAGSTNTTVLRFNTITINGPGALYLGSAINGDAISISQSGIYTATLSFSQAADFEVRLGISLNATGGFIDTDPAMTIGGMLVVGGALVPVATTGYSNMTATLLITAALAEAGALVRAHGSDGGAGLIDDDAIGVNTDCFLRVVKVSNIIV